MSTTIRTDLDDAKVAAGFKRMAKASRDAGSEMQSAAKSTDAALDKMAQSATKADSQITKMGSTILKTAVPSVGRFVEAFGRVGPVAGAAIAIIGSVGFAVNELTKKIKHGIDEGSTLDNLMKLDNPTSGFFEKMAGKASEGFSKAASSSWFFGGAGTFDKDEVAQEQRDLKATASMKIQFSKDFANLDNIRKSAEQALHAETMRASLEEIDQTAKLTEMLEKEQERVALLADEKKLSDEESTKSIALQNSLIQKRIELQQKSADSTKEVLKEFEDAMKAGKDEAAGAGKSFWSAISDSDFQRDLDTMLEKTKSTGAADKIIRQEMEKIVDLEKKGTVSRQDYERASKTILALKEREAQVMKDIVQRAADHLALQFKMRNSLHEQRREQAAGLADQIGEQGGGRVVADIDALRNQQNMGDKKLMRQAQTAARKALQEKLKAIDVAFQEEANLANAEAAAGEIDPRDATKRIAAARQVRGQDRKAAIGDRENDQQEQFLDMQKKARDAVVDFAQGQGQINKKVADVAKSIVEKFDEKSREMDEAMNILDQILGRLGAQGRAARNQRKLQR